MRVTERQVQYLGNIATSDGRYSELEMGGHKGSSSIDRTVIAQINKLRRTEQLTKLIYFYIYQNELI